MKLINGRIFKSVNLVTYGRHWSQFGILTGTEFRILNLDAVVLEN
jgi:hypothetical protein